jgi:hypothetical protein
MSEENVEIVRGLVPDPDMDTAHRAASDGRTARRANPACSAKSLRRSARPDVEPKGPWNTPGGTEERLRLRDDEYDRR